jgi:hypothetical protein
MPQKPLDSFNRTPPRANPKCRNLGGAKRVKVERRNEQYLEARRTAIHSNRMVAREHGEFPMQFGFQEADEFSKENCEEGEIGEDRLL